MSDKAYWSAIAENARRERAMIISETWRFAAWSNLKRERAALRSSKRREKSSAR